jgi:nucleolar complex protein 3
MGRVPAAKRQKLTPLTTDEEESTVSTLEAVPEKNTFFKQAPSWNLEQDYETRPRKGKKKEKESTRLPIKTSEGLIQQVEEPEEAQDEESDLEWLGADGSDEEKFVEEVRKPTISVRQQILEAKEELAQIALLLNEDPEENSGAFKTLAQFTQSPNTTIKKLALATQLAVYKDVIPGYRIRPLSDEDMETKVSKEVRKLRAYEQALVGGYQGYIRDLAKLVQSGRGTIPESGPSLSSVAIGCACTLLISVPHFNFRGELLKILVGKLSTRKIDDDFNKCRETIETLFRDDEDGTPSLDAVALLTKMMKGRGYRVDESVLNTFLHLRLLSEFSQKASTNHVDKPSAKNGDNAKFKTKVFLTKKGRKLLKERNVVEKEMKQADALVSHEERDKMQAETLKLVFVTYFRILKIRSPSLMGAVLEGLARYAHLINQDFFGDLLEALKDLIGHAQTGDDVEEMDQAEDDDVETARNHTREALLCVITAFALLEGQDAHKAKATLSLDLSFFITHLYQNLYSLSLNPDIELSAKSLHLADPNDPNTLALTTTNNKINIQTTTVLLLRSLNSILLPPLAQRAVPPLRIAAFAKQLLTSSLHLPEKSCMAMMGLLGKVTKTHEKKIAALWNTEERRGDGTFDPLSGEVDGSNPFAATIWEGEILRKHFCPSVRDGVKIIEKNILGLR